MSENITILFLTRRFYPDIGGVEKHVLEISKILKDENFQINVITENNDDKYLPFENLNDIKIYRIPSLKENKFKKFKIWFWFLKNINLILSSDIIHAHDVFFWYMPFKFLFPLKKCYITFHGYETIFPPLKSAIKIRQLSKALSNGAINIGEYIYKWYKTPANFTLYGGVDKNNFSQKGNTKNGIINILFVGRIEKDNSIEIYSKFLEILKNSKIKFKFIALGDGSLKKNFERFGEVKGFINDTEKYLKKADIVFSSSYLSILEAFSFKKLVISVWDNQLKKDYLEMTPFSRFLIIGSSAEELVNKFFKISEKEKVKILNAEYNWVKENTWEDVVKIYKKLWKIN